MKNIFVITILMIYALSCRSNDNKLVGNEDSLAVKTVQGFYSWYIHEAYPKSTSHYQVPDYKKIDGTTYIFDLEDYKERLNTIKYFSKEYKQKLIDKLQACNQEMKETKWDYEPEPMFNIKACNYLWGNQWVGGQGEMIDGFQIDSIKVNNNTAESIVSILIDNKVFVRSILSLKKVGNEYKISDIVLDWKKN